MYATFKQKVGQMYINKDYYCWAYFTLYYLALNALYIMLLCYIVEKCQMEKFLVFFLNKTKIFSL